MGFPETRMRRLRRSAVLREMLAETTLTVKDLVAPLFVREGIDTPQPVASLPGVVQHTVESLVKEARRLSGAGDPRPCALRRPCGKGCRGIAGLVPRWHRPGGSLIAAP